MKTIKLLSTTALLLASSFFATSANAATFQIAFDNSFNSTMDDNNIVGTGTLSYDGPISEGVFALNTLNNLDLSINLAGEIFTDQDIDAQFDLSKVDLNIIRDGDTLFATFIGQEAQFNTALAFENTSSSNGSMQFLATEPGTIDGGFQGGTNLARSYNYFNFSDSSLNLSGTYQMTAPAPVPEPGTIALFGFGLIGIVFARKRLSK